MPIISNISSNSKYVEGTVIDLVIGDVPQIKMKKKKMKRKLEKRNRKFEGICYDCGQKGHISKDCCVH